MESLGPSNRSNLENQVIVYSCSHIRYKLVSWMGHFHGVVWNVMYSCSSALKIAINSLNESSSFLILNNSTIHSHKGLCLHKSVSH